MPVTVPHHPPGIDRVLRLSRRVTGHEYAGISVPDLSFVPADGSATPATPAIEEPLIAATVARAGVYQDADIAVPGPSGLRSYAGVALRAESGGVLGALWVGSTTPHALDADALAALADLGAILGTELDRSDRASLAAEVQRQLLPERAPAAPGLDMAAACRPAQEVGGDFYDWWRRGDELQIVVADVMGKGVPAAIVGSAIRAMLHAALSFHPPGAALRRVGGDLQSDLDQVARFATCFAARLDLETYQLTFVDAGHGLALILRADGSVTRLSSNDPPLGAMPDAVWQEQVDRLAPGELLLVASDGVLDLFETTAEYLACAQKLHRGGARAADYVAELVRDAAATAPGDDLTVLAIGRPAEPR